MNLRECASRQLGLQIAFWLTYFHAESFNCASLVRNYFSLVNRVAGFCRTIRWNNDFTVSKWICGLTIIIKIKYLVKRYLSNISIVISTLTFHTICQLDNNFDIHCLTQATHFNEKLSTKRVTLKFCVILTNIVYIFILLAAFLNLID